jgi:hypothetical protein
MRIGRRLSGSPGRRNRGRGRSDRIVPWTFTERQQAHALAREGIPQRSPVPAQTDEVASLAAEGSLLDVFVPGELS